MLDWLKKWYFDWNSCSFSILEPTVWTYRCGSVPFLMSRTHRHYADSHWSWPERNLS